MTDWVRVRRAIEAGDVAALGPLVDRADLASGRWWLLQVASDDATALALVDFLLNHGAPATARDDDGYGALHFAAKFPRAVERLLAAGAPVNLTEKRGLSPLHFAADEGSREVVSLLLAAGARVDEASKDGATALRFACSQGHEAVALALLEAGARLDLDDDYRKTLLRLARTSMGDAEAVLRRLGWSPPPLRPAPLAPPAVARLQPTRTAPSPAGLAGWPEWNSFLDGLGETLRELAESAATSGEYEDGPAHLYTGDVRLTGTLALPPGVHLFTGNLELDGALLVPDGDGLLFVAGSARVSHLVDEGCTLIGGDLDARGLVYGNSGCDRFLAVGGHLTARALVEDGHSTSIAGRLDAGTVVSRHGLIELSDGALDETDVDLDALLDPRAVAGTRIRRKQLRALLEQGIDPLLGP